MSIRSAAIIGAGVAGLTAALSLARHGIRSDIFEQADTLTEVGAGLQLSPNASRVLGELGLLQALSEVWLEPRDVSLVSGRSLRRIASVPCGSFARARWGAPYGVLHRATLQRVLVDAVKANPLCTLHLSTLLANPSLQYLSQAGLAAADVLIGADGVWSRTRTQVPASPAPRFSGNIAWRFILREADAPRFLDRTSVTAFLGPSAHLVCYPLKETGGFNVVAIAAGSSSAREWGAAGSEAQRTMLIRQFAGWNAEIGRVLADAAQATFWPLYELGNGRWHNGRDTILIGDAAHAMMPFAAQGAAMAIEDAYELAGMLATHPLAEAFDLFETRRQPRIARLRQRAAFNRFAYHARGPLRIGRDVVLALRPPQSLAADFDWLYGYRAVG
ncbi:FAD-dependent monooxygenase [Rhizobium sp. BK251]|uniref:FAD-dependent monooxygenase n=1 Tax=Rhizobium sp. BK251 TaxID=2512125 RepID=UPI00104F7328|nr:FAD-dependent monooxygenase [Rhizobium sp. BK251]TCL74039.1 salicylate hydroxylase [Rhizobium sp. BK251]